jgi:hypothetical protein
MVGIRDASLNEHGVGLSKTGTGNKVPSFYWINQHVQIWLTAV